MALAVAISGLFLFPGSAPASPHIPHNSLIVTGESETPDPNSYWPEEIRKAYKIPEAGGSDQTIAIIGMGGNPNAESDLNAYRNEFDMPPCTEANGCFRRRNAWGYASNFPPSDKDAAEETSMDLEMASVACPECKLLLVEASGGIFPPYFWRMGEAVDGAVALGATEVSISFGGEEGLFTKIYNRKFNHPGIPITAASGDWGYRNFKVGGDGPNYPASAPGVIAVGGTNLWPAPKTPREWLDTVWSKTGSGCSSHMARPEWQNFTSSCGHRITNDVSIVASNVAYYASYKQDENWHVGEGTSIGAPLIAGIYAHASETVRNNPAKALYKDLSTGIGSIYDVGPHLPHNNTNYQGHSCSPSYLCNGVAGRDGKSLEGYDGPTGVGVPQGVPVLPVWGRESAEGVEGLEPEDTYRFEGMDCVAPDECIAVGRTEQQVSVAAEWDGYDWDYLEWEKLPTPFFEGEWGEVDAGSWLKDVSCIAANRCIAVGMVDEGAIAMWWDGEEWSEDESFPLLNVSEPPSSISCVSPTSCMVVGADHEQPYSVRWNGSSWSTPSVPGAENPFDGAELLGVSCSIEEVENKEKEPEEICVAAGWFYPETEEGGFFQAFVEVWDGSEWSIDTSLTPPGAESYLYDIDCPNHSSCMAVGFATESEEYEEYRPLALHWDGSQWVTGSPPLFQITGESEKEIEAEEIEEEKEEGEAIGVSCATATSCVAVGSSYGGQVMLDGWNGTSWSAQEHSAVKTTAAYSTLNHVSCPLVNSCAVVGNEWTGIYLNPLIFAQQEEEDPNPTVWTPPLHPPAPNQATLNATVNPNGSATTYQFEYGTTAEYGSKAPASPKSIGSGTSPVEVSEKIEGLAPETTYHFRLVATNEKGATVEGEDQTFTTPAWKILSTPNPKEASDSNLYDVSCEPSTNVCTAVGKSTKSAVDSPLAQRWNGSSWSEQTPAKKSGSTHNRLLGIDCPSETRCIAVGNYQNSEGGPATLGELWNENKWNVQTTPVPSEASASELVAVGCNSTANCRAAGSAVIKGTKTAIVEKWVSPTWSSESIPIPEGATSSQLDGIDCIWSNFCAAVGRYTTSGGSVKSLVMFWNGTEWSLQSVTDPEGAVQSTLLDISCTPTPNRCTAVGGWKNSEGEQFTLAYRFNGTSTWTLQSTPNPSESFESVFQDVSCATETSCTAAGSWGGVGESTQTLAEKWNGSSWSIQGTSNPSGAAFSSLFGISCRSTTCVGVGWSTDGSGVDTTLGETSDLSEPPTIETKSASSIMTTEATLNTTVNPNGSATTYQFEYGTTAEYGSKAPASPKSIGSGTSPVEVSEKIEGLAPETTYHFRLVATNEKGATVEGEDQTFTTPAWKILSTPNPKEASDSNS